MSSRLWRRGPRGRGRLGGWRGGRCVGRGYGSSNGKGVSRIETALGEHFGGWVYYSVGFFEEFIFGSGTGEGVLITVCIVSLEKVVE